MYIIMSTRSQLANNTALQAEIKNAIISKLMSNNPQLAKALVYRSTHAHLYGSGDHASFYDNNGTGTYKQELQNYLASIKVEINNILGTGYLEKILPAKCLYNFIVFQPVDLFTNEPILCD